MATERLISDPDTSKVYDALGQKETCLCGGFFFLAVKRICMSAMFGTAFNNIQCRDCNLIPI